MAFVETPEFWSALAFILVVLVTGYPLARALKSWGKQKADDVQSQLDKAQNLVNQAETLRQQYKTVYTGRNSERQKLMHQAETEIRFLETEALEQSADRMKRKTQEVEMRLKMIAEHGRQDIKHKMLDRVVQKTEKLLADPVSDAVDEDTDHLTERVLSALDSFEPVLK